MFPRGDLNVTKANNHLSAAWVSVVDKSIQAMPGNLPWPTPQEFLDALGNGEWNSVSWIESQLEHRGFRDIAVNAVTKSTSLLVSEFIESVMMMIPMVAQRFWSEEQREQSGDKFRPALQKYLNDTYGQDGVVPGDWTAIISTARKPERCSE